jgi:small-conductance mechanosensitive channel
MDFPIWLATTAFLGITLDDWTIALVSAVLSYFVMTTVLRLAQTRIHRKADQKAALEGDGVIASVRPILAQVLDQTNRWLLLAAAVLIGLHLLDLPSRWADRVSQLWFVTVALQLALWGAKVIELLMQRYLSRHSSAGSTPQASVSSTLIGWALHTALWTVVALAVLSNLGFNITAFVASLGIGGIAVALAAQNILGDLFASVAIALDKPFEVGDAIANSSGTIAGTVEHVGLKTTRLRSASGEQVVVSNTELLKDSLKNYKRMETRRIEFKLGITYSATPEQAATVPQIIKRVIESHEQVKFDRAHFTGFGESSLDFVVVYIMQTANYGIYMDTQQAINIALMKEFADLGVEFAFPTRTVILEQAQPSSGDEAAEGGAARRPVRAGLGVAH